MRVPLAGIAATGETVRFAYDGRAVEACPGDTIASALLEAGETCFRLDRAGEPRAPFCGMGVCFECLVTVDGHSRRACLEPVRDGMSVAPHRHAEPSAHGAGRAPERRDADVLVIGGGPAGLAATALVAEAGLRILLVDERAQLGGQYYKQPA